MSSILNGKHILFVDDKPETLGLCILKLSESGAVLDFAESLDKALQLLGNKLIPGKGFQYDLICIDLNIPGVVPLQLSAIAHQLPSFQSGRAIGDYIVRNDNNIKVIYFSVLSNHVINNECLDSKFAVVCKSVVSPPNTIIFFEKLFS